MLDPDNDSYQSDKIDSEDDEEEESDCDSVCSMYQLTKARQPFVSLNIMILMEYAESETLRDVIADSRGFLTRSMIFNLFTQLMTALKHIHSNGLIHRDIKPENIFVNRKTHRLQVGDFGLAKAVRVVDDGKTGVSRQTLDDRQFSNRDLGGTPMYLSPEQKSLNSRLDILSNLPREKVDIYAAGLVLFEMCGQFKSDHERCSSMEPLIKK